TTSTYLYLLVQSFSTNDPIRSRPFLDFAMAPFIIASTAIGDCSQMGIVKTALAFAAADRKSSTVFSSAAEKLGLAAAKTNDRKKTEDFMVVEIGHTCMRTQPQRQIDGCSPRGVCV